MKPSVLVHIHIPVPYEVEGCY